MKNTRISIRYAPAAELEEILQKLSDLYARSGQSTFHLYKHRYDKDVWMLQFEHSPDAFHMACFVNYLHYARSREKRPFLVRGYCYASGPEGNESVSYKPVMVYVSGKDRGYDNVSMVSRENAAWHYDFGGNLKVIDHPEQAYIDDPMHNDLFVYHRTLRPLQPTAREQRHIPRIAGAWWRFWQIKAI